MLMLVFDCLTMFRLLPMLLKFYRITCLVRRCKSRVLREVLQRNGIDMVLCLVRHVFVTVK